MKSARAALAWASILTFFLSGMTLQETAAVASPLDPSSTESPKSVSMTLDTDRFLCRAIKGGEDFRSLEALMIEASAPRLRAEASIADELNVGVTYLRDETEPPTPFQPALTRTRRYTLGYEKRFPSGTSLSSELRHDSVLIDFQQFPRAEYFETYGVVTLRQSLWADSFGSSTRLGLEAGDLFESGNRKAYWGQAARQAFELLGRYSGTWLARRNLEFSRDALATRKRYLSVVEKQRRRGTISRPEFLQVRSSVTSAETALESARQDLNEAWLDLAVATATTSDWTINDAEKVELDMTSPIALATQTCSRDGKLSAAPETNSEIEGLVSLVDAARKTVRQIKGRAAPDLAFTLALSANGLDPDDRGQTITEFARFDNPAITAGLGLTIPLGNPAVEAELAQSQAQLLRLESRLSRARLTLQTEWQNGCSDLARLVETVRAREQIVRDQKERIQNLEARFRVGRSGAFDLVLAADEARGAETAFAAAKRELFLATWQVLLANEHLTELVRNLKRQENCP